MCGPARGVQLAEVAQRARLGFGPHAVDVKAFGERVLSKLGRHLDHVQHSKPCVRFLGQCHRIIPALGVTLPRSPPSTESRGTVRACSQRYPARAAAPPSSGTVPCESPFSDRSQEQLFESGPPVAANDQEIGVSGVRLREDFPMYVGGFPDAQIETQV